MKRSQRRPGPRPQLPIPKRCPKGTTVISLKDLVVAMRDEILTYWEMCSRERLALQRGMYFRKAPAASIVLMSQRPGAPYEDSLSEDGGGPQL